MIKSIELRPWQASSPRCFGRCRNQILQRFLSCLVTQIGRCFSIIILFSTVWRTTVCSAAVIAQTQNSSSDNSYLSTSKPVILRKSVEKAEVPHSPFSMADHSCFQPVDLLSNSSTRPISLMPTYARCQNMKNTFASNDGDRSGRSVSSKLCASLTGHHSQHCKQDVEDVGPHSNPRNADLRSLKALVSLSSPSLLYSLQAKSAPHNPEQSTLTSKYSNGMRIYRVGVLDFIVNRLPNTLSVSSLHSLSHAQRQMVSHLAK
jgi:hypothetical protein